MISSGIPSLRSSILSEVSTYWLASMIAASAARIMPKPTGLRIRLRRRSLSSAGTG